MAANGRRLHWYRSRFTRPAIAVAIGVLAYLLSLILGRFVFNDTDSNDAGSLEYPPVLVRLIVVPLTVPVLFSPFVLWQLWNSRRARWTGHHHQTRAPFPPPRIVDVCDAARRLRLRGDKYLAARFGACVLLAVASGVTLSPIVAVVAIGCLPLVWALSALHEQKYRPAAVVPVGSSVVRPKPTVGRRLLLWTAAALFQVTGVFLIVLGWMIVVLMVSLAPLAVLLGLKAPAVELVFGGPAIIALITVYLAGFSALARVGRRLRLMSAGLANQAHARPFVLYLRAFVDDRSMIVSGGSDWWRLVEFFSFRARISLDEAVARRLGRTSSVVSIAEPASPRLYLPLGAARRRVSDDEWRDFVVARMQEASLIVISAGTTEALLWEIGTATKKGCLDRLVMVVPPGDDAEVRQRWSASAAAVTEAGGPALTLDADPASVLLVRLSPAGTRQAFVVDEIDESAYATALDRLLVLDAAVR